MISLHSIAANLYNGDVKSENVKMIIGFWLALHTWQTLVFILIRYDNKTLVLLLHKVFSDDFILWKSPIILPYVPKIIVLTVLHAIYIYILAVHTDLLEYIRSAFWHLSDGLDGFVQALYAIGGEAPQFLHPNFPYFAQEPK